MLIIAAAPTVDQEALDSLLEKHDQARTSEEKEVVGQEVETLIGSTVRAMLGRDLRGLGLSEEEFGALVTELVHRALAESGITRLRREDLVPERLVEEMHTTSQGHRLWTLLPPTCEKNWSKVHAPERAVGEFMATHPNAGADQIEQYLSTLDPGVANDIREIGWDTVVNEVDSRVLEMIRDPASRAELAERLGLDLESLTAGVEAIRRTVFGRRVRQMRLAS